MPKPNRFNQPYTAREKPLKKGVPKPLAKILGVPAVAPESREIDEFATYMNDFYRHEARSVEGSHWFPCVFEDGALRQWVASRGLATPIGGISRSDHQVYINSRRTGSNWVTQEAIDNAIRESNERIDELQIRRASGLSELGVTFSVSLVEPPLVGVDMASLQIGGVSVGSISSLNFVDNQPRSDFELDFTRPMACVIGSHTTQRSVRIICFDARGEYPVVALIESPNAPMDNLCRFRRNGIGSTGERLVYA